MDSQSLLYQTSIHYIKTVMVSSANAEDEKGMWYGPKKPNPQLYPQLYARSDIDKPTEQSGRAMFSKDPQVRRPAITSPNCWSG